MPDCPATIHVVEYSHTIVESLEVIFYSKRAMQALDS